MTGLCLVLVATGCRSVQNARTVSAGELADESTVVVVRPDRYSVLGSRSVREYLEIVYEEFDINDAGQAVVRLGIRNQGGKKWWDLKGPDFTIAVQAIFYSQPVMGAEVRSAPLYRTNKRSVPMPRGEVSDLAFKCPVSGAGGYQVVISER
jgi:hypothetical protein